MLVTIFYRKEGDVAASTQHKEVGIDLVGSTVRELCNQGYVIVSVSEVQAVY